MQSLMPTPRSVDIEVTSRCSLRCRYCYHFNSEGAAHKDLPTADWVEFIQELAEGKVLVVCLAGGEPFLRPDLFEIIEAIVRNRMRFRILTNGHGITPESATRLLGTNRCDLVQVSLDGSTPAVHEKLRGEGSFRTAIGAIRLLKEAGLPLTVRVTVNPHNIDDLPALAGLLLEEIGIAGFSTNSVSCLGNRLEYGHDVLLAPVERLRAMRVLMRLDAQYPGRISASAGPLAIWRKYCERKAGKADTSNSRPGYLSGCRCSFSRLAVRADGAYIPCPLLPQMVLGYVGQVSMVEVWQNSPRLEALRRRATIALNDFPYCRGCRYIDTCTGGCPANAVSLLGAADRPSPESCLQQFIQELAAEGVSSIW
jgi:SynChlorMet cassette radical SAM/SPASM protein ScmE